MTVPVAFSCQCLYVIISSAEFSGPYPLFVSCSDHVCVYVRTHLVQHDICRLSALFVLVVLLEHHLLSYYYTIVCPSLVCLVKTFLDGLSVYPCSGPTW
jgi:hypothetical protein